MPTEILESDRKHEPLRVCDAWSLLRFRDDDRFSDAVEEVSAITGGSSEESRKLVRAVLDWYHDKVAAYPEGVDRTLADLVIHVSQPYRIPIMTERMDLILDRLKDRAPATLLDYGGGGGKDTIIFARSGFRVTYCDILGTLTPYVRRRFELRGLDADVRDVRDLPDSRHDVINCMDVVEHVYDVEYVVADLIARLRVGGQLLCYPAFHNTWDGDHVEKNCGYGTYFAEMLASSGLRPLRHFDPHARNSGRLDDMLVKIGIRNREMPVFHFERTRPISGNVPEEREEIRHQLYSMSRRYSVGRAALSLFFLPLVAVPALVVPVPRLRRKGRNTMERLFANSIDNLAIWRLSRRRMWESAQKRGGDRRESP